MKKKLNPKENAFCIVCSELRGKSGPLVGFLILLFSFSGYTQTLERFTLKYKDITVEQLIDTIQSKSSYSFFYKDHTIDVRQRVTIDIENQPVGVLLARVFQGKNIAYKIQGNLVVLTPVTASPVTGKKMTTIKGLVTTTMGEPIPGATVKIVNTSTGVVTDIDGWYVISVPDKETQLEFRFLGYETQIITVGNRTALHVSLTEAKSELEEVVIVGYGAQKKVTVTGSVASVDMADMRTPGPNLSNVLQGKVAGIISVQANGEPGYDNSTFTIRGIGTFAGSTSPLVIVDGVQRDDVNSTYGGAYNNIDPEDIVSISLLKDASATAVYGAKGANGVMIITTKRGSVGKPKISFKAESGISGFTKLPKMLSGVDYMKLYNEGRRNAGLAETYTKDRILKTASGLDPYLYPDVDWMETIYKKFASLTNINLNITGGSELVRYYLSASFYNQQGQYKVKNENGFDPNLNFKRYDFRSNIDVNITKTTLLQMNLAAMLVDARYPGISAAKLWYLSYATSPVAFPVRYPDGRWAGPTANAGSNPLNEVQNNGYTDMFRPALQSVFTLNQKLDFVTEGLSSYVRFSFDSYGEFNNVRSGGVDLWHATGRDGEGNLIFGTPVKKGSDVLEYSHYDTGERVMYLEANIAYDRIFGSHRMSGMVLYNMRNRLIATAGDAVSSIPYRNQAIAGRLSYAYKEKYLAEFNASYTGSENFAKGNRFGFFPAASVGWVISNEKFFGSAGNVFDLLKLRASYGVVGNDNISGNRFAYFSQIGGGKSYGFGANGTPVYGITETLLGVDGLTWERSYKTNLGLELIAFRNLSLTADMYWEKRKDILISRASLPGMAGFDAAIYANMGEMNNRGFDCNLEYKANIGKVGLRVYGNATYSKNKIVFMDEPVRHYAYQSQTGTRYGEFYGYVDDGLFVDADQICKSPAQLRVVYPGDIKYKNLNPEEGEIIDASDEKYLGKSWFPSWSYGAGFNINYHRFDLSLFFQGVADVGIMANGSSIQGGDWGASGVGIVPFSGMGQYPNNVIEKALDRWTEENPRQDAWYPRMSYNATVTDNNYVNSTRWLKDGSYVRLKQASLGYTLETKGLEKTGISYLYFYLSGQNLLTFSKFKLWDPELGSNASKYPLTRMVTLGIRVQF